MKCTLDSECSTTTSDTCKAGRCICADDDAPCDTINVNNCQYGICMCGDYDACEITSDTCLKSSDGIYEATCRCGEGEACEDHEICNSGRCVIDPSKTTVPTTRSKLLLVTSTFISSDNTFLGL